MKPYATLLQAYCLSGVLALTGHVGWVDTTLDVGRINGDNNQIYLYIGVGTLAAGETGPVEKGQLVHFESRRVLNTNIAFDIDIDE